MDHCEESSVGSSRSTSPTAPEYSFSKGLPASQPAKAQAARTRRVALEALLELDHTRLSDLGISRADITNALVRKDKCPELALNAARASNARL